MTCKEMIDATGFKTLIGHLQNNPDIHTIIQVFDADLAEVGEAFKEETNIEQVQELFAEKIIGIYAFNKGGGINRNNIIPEVSLTQAVDCLYLPPYYLFKDLKKEWE